MDEKTALIIFVAIPLVANLLSMLLRAAGFTRTAQFIDAMAPMSVKAAKDAMTPALPPKDSNGSGDETVH